MMNSIIDIKTNHPKSYLTVEDAYNSLVDHLNGYMAESETKPHGIVDHIHLTTALTKWSILLRAIYEAQRKYETAKMQCKIDFLLSELHFYRRKCIAIYDETYKRLTDENRELMLGIEKAVNEVMDNYSRETLHGPACHPITKNQLYKRYEVLLYSDNVKEVK